MWRRRRRTAGRATTYRYCYVCEQEYEFRAGAAKQDGCWTCKFCEAQMEGPELAGHAPPAADRCHLCDGSARRTPVASLPPDDPRKAVLGLCGACLRRMSRASRTRPA